MTDYLTSLIGTESGGNFAARNNEVGSGGQRGHYGRVQFGRARLQDAMNAGVIPQGTTPEQFLANPALQVATERWHFADLEAQLAPYVGTVVDGQTLDMGALVAMGHLGGAAGARRYVESGGEYNPSDSFGTSLSDYASTHGGLSAPAIDRVDLPGMLAPPAPSTLGGLLASTFGGTFGGTGARGGWVAPPPRAQRQPTTEVGNIQNVNPGVLTSILNEVQTASERPRAVRRALPQLLG